MKTIVQICKHGDPNTVLTQCDYMNDKELAKAVQAIFAHKDGVDIVGSDAYAHYAPSPNHAILYLATLALSDEGLLLMIRGRRARMDFAAQVLYFLSEELGEHVDLDCLSDIGITKEFTLSNPISMEDFVDLLNLPYDERELDLPYELSSNIKMLVSYYYLDEVERDEIAIDGLRFEMNKVGESAVVVTLEEALRHYVGESK